MSKPPLPAFRFDQFYRYEELTALLRECVQARPQLLRMESIGKSYEGRELWLLVVTQQATGPDTDKPAFWVDGNIHAAELTASTACLYWLDQLLKGYGHDEAVTHLLDTRVVYLVPRLCPDGAELALAKRPRHIRSSTRAYPWDEPVVEGLVSEDMDGDGRILTMRIQDPHGTYKACSADARLMVPREPGEFGGTYYRLIPEGRLLNYDGVRIQWQPDREGLDLNRNFPAYWRQEFEQKGAGPYPTSEPEVRAMVDFIARHPNIGAAVSFHTHSGVILRPMGTQSDDDMTPEDLWMIKRLSDLGQQLTGYPAVSIFHEFKYHPKETITGTQDWVYEHQGALFWTVEIWAPNKEAGIQDYQWIEWYRDHPVEDDLKLLQWSDEHCGGQAHVDWYPYEHPQLGPVELGGWDRMNFWRNPPAHLREREVARFPGWLQQLALSLPRLELLHTQVQALGEDTYRVRVAVANAGYLPSFVTRRALERKIVRGTVFELSLPPGAQLVSGSTRVVGPHLEGHAPKTTLQSVPERNVTADRAVAEWWVRGQPGMELSCRVTADRAGSVVTQVRLA